MTSTATATVLSNNWQWRQRDLAKEPLQHDADDLASESAGADADAGSDDGWTNCVAFPSEIHVELLKAGKIPDPYLGFNEHKVQWVGDREWLYRTTFDCETTGPKADLVFEGLDTFCTVYLNGEVILQADNQFTPYTVPIHPKPKGNTLLLHFFSAKAIALQLEEKYGRVRAGSINLGHPSRVYVRKAQYDWRWDWGPELMTVGPYRPIILKTYTAVIMNIYPRTFVNRSSATSPGLTASLKLQVSVDGDVSVIHHASVVLVSSGDAHAKPIKLATKHTESLDWIKSAGNDSSTNVIDWDFHEGEVELWWPVGYGKQPLYDVVVILKNKEGAVLDQQTKRIGFRTVELVQQPFDPKDGDHAALDRFHHGKGSTFFFRVNGVPIFIGGSNWIPADNFLTTIKPERYRAWLQLLKDGNQNMIRVWGGGIYEEDVFYDTCDELGILVWQDFQFACGVYPANEDFLRSVAREAELNVLRLRHHPAIVLWCGNNEDYQQIEQWGEDKVLPAREIYEHILPNTINRLTDHTPYHFGSPYGGKIWWDTADPTQGDIHQWDVWAGKERNYLHYDELGGRFVSEFGMPAMPDRRTIEYWLEDGHTSEAEKRKLRYSQSKGMQQHNKAGSHERRFAVLMSENFRLTSDFDEHIYLTQLLQSEAVGYAYRVWRREWRGAGREYNAGAIVWQLNDCWPVTSWAIADYFLRPKPVWYTIAREMATVTVGIQRSVVKNRDNDRPKQYYEFGAFQSRSASLEVWATNSGTQSRKVAVELEFFDLNSSWKASHAVVEPVELAPNSSTEILAGLEVLSPPPRHAEGYHLSDSDPWATRSFSVVAVARLRDPGQENTVIARFSDWPQPYRMLDVPEESQVTIVVSLHGDIPQVRLSANARPVKGVVLSADQESAVRWSDNAIDLVPGDDQVVFAEGLKSDQVRVRYLGGSS